MKNLKSKNRNKTMKTLILGVNKQNQNQERNHELQADTLGSTRKFWIDYIHMVEYDEDAYWPNMV